MSYDGGYSRSRGGDYDNETSKDIYVPKNECGKIIGRGGARIRELQDSSRCRIKVCGDDEGDGTRRVELVGSGDAISEAECLINQILESGDDRGKMQQQQQQSHGYGGSKETIQVRSDSVGRIIGKGGSRIRELQEDTGCRINVSRDGGRHGQTDVELMGSQSQRDCARDAIHDLVSQFY